MRIFFKVGGTIVSALATITFMVSDIRETVYLFGYTFDWRWFTLGGFIAFLGFVSWWIGGLYGRIHKLEGYKPSIEVKPQNYVNDYFLEVRNFGGTGKFETHIEILKSDATTVPHGLNKYEAFWEYANGRQAQILSGKIDRMKIAQLISYPTPAITEHLELYYYNSAASQRAYFDSDSHILGAMVTKKNGTKQPVAEPEYTLEVTISSEPKLKGGVFVRRYKLGLGGLEELSN